MNPAVTWPDNLNPGKYHLVALLTAPGAPDATYSADVTIGAALPNSGRPIVFATPTHKHAPIALIAGAFVVFGAIAGAGGVLLGRRGPGGLPPSR